MAGQEFEAVLIKDDTRERRVLKTIGMLKEQ